MSEPYLVDKQANFGRLRGGNDPKFWESFLQWCRENCGTDLRGFDPGPW